MISNAKEITHPVGPKKASPNPEDPTGQYLKMQAPLSLLHIPHQIEPITNLAFQHINLRLNLPRQRRKEIPPPRIKIQKPLPTNHLEIQSRKTTESVQIQA